MMVGLAIRILTALGRWPLPVVRFLGAGLGMVFYVLGAERRNVALKNLSLCFPGMPEKERRRLARAHFRAFAKSVLDRGMLWTAPAERIKKHVHWQGMENFEAASKRGPV